MKKYIKPFAKKSVLLSSILLVACGSDDNPASISTNASFSNSANTTTIAASGEAGDVPITKNVQIIPENITATTYLETVYEENADKLKLVFDNIKLPEGAYVEIIDSGNQSHFYKLTQSLASGIEVMGNTATIRVVLPEINNNASLTLKSITILEKKSKREPRVIIGVDERRPLECFNGTDIYNHSLAATSPRFGGTGSGAIVGNGKYVLTNAHVAGSAAVVGQKMEGSTLLGWYNETCTSEEQLEINSIPIRTDTVISKGTPASGTDYALVSLNNFDTQNSGAMKVFGSMKISEGAKNKVGDEIYIPQYGHGRLQPMVVGDKHDGKNGAITKVEDNLGGNIEYFVDTEPGSSGSPVLSLNTHEIVGVNWGNLYVFNRAVSLSTLQKDILPIFSKDNASSVGEGKFKGRQLIVPPFLTSQSESTNLPANSYIVPFDGIKITHYEGYSEVELNSQNVVNNEVSKLVYRVALKTNSGTRNLSNLATSSDSLIVWDAANKSNKNSETKSISWLPLRIVDRNGKLLQNRILHLTHSSYDPYTSPFDTNANDTVKMDLVISDSGKNATVSQLNEGAQYSYISAYTGEGPATLLSENDVIGNYATIYLPLKQASGQEIIVKLRGYRKTDCSTRSMNSGAGCAVGQRSTFRVDYVPSDNPNIVKGTYTGILPIFAQSGQLKKNILVNIKLSQP